MLGGLIYVFMQIYKVLKDFFNFKKFEVRLEEHNWFLNVLKTERDNYEAMTTMLGNTETKEIAVDIFDNIKMAVEEKISKNYQTLK
jgi:hypothetical protein